MRCIFSLKLDQKQQKCPNIVILAKEWETLARQTVQFFKSGPKIFCHLVQFTINVAVPIFLGDSRIQYGSRSQTSKSSRSRQRILGSKYLLSEYFSTFPSLLFKGQFISKCPFGVFKSSKKRNFHKLLYATSKKKDLVLFSGVAMFPAGST